MATTPARARPAYDGLARAYDAFTSASDYEAWTDHVLSVAAGHGWEGGAVLDVACGTGKSFVPFLRRGFPVTGSDISAAMLAEAADKAPEVPLIEADMRSLPRLGAFELVICFDDSLNHLLAEEDLACALMSMAGNLASHGLLLFDLNTLLTYRTTFARDSLAEHDGFTFLMHGESSPDAPAGCRASVTVDVFAERDDGLYERFGARLEQRHFASKTVHAALARAGLECVGAYGVLGDGSPAPALDETRQLKALYVARLAKGGDPA